MRDAAVIQCYLYQTVKKHFCEMMKARPVFRCGKMLERIHRVKSNMNSAWWFTASWGGVNLRMLQHRPNHWLHKPEVPVAPVAQCSTYSLWSLELHNSRAICCLMVMISESSASNEVFGKNLQRKAALFERAQWRVGGGSRRLDRAGAHRTWFDSTSGWSSFWWIKDIYPKASHLCRIYFYAETK